MYLTSYNFAFFSRHICNFASYKLLHYYFWAHHSQTLCGSTCTCTCVHQAVLQLPPLVFSATSTAFYSVHFSLCHQSRCDYCNVDIVSHPPAFIRDPVFTWYDVGLHETLIRNRHLIVELPGSHIRIMGCWYYIHVHVCQPTAKLNSTYMYITRDTLLCKIPLVHVSIFALNNYCTILTTPTRNDHTHIHKQYGCPHKPKENGVSWFLWDVSLHSHWFLTLA